MQIRQRRTSRRVARPSAVFVTTFVAAFALLTSACQPADDPDISVAETDATAATDSLSVLNCLTPEHITECLRSTALYFPSRPVSAGDTASPLPKSSAPFAAKYAFSGQEQSLDTFPERTRTTGLIVVHQGTVLYENYFRGATEESQFLSMSMSMAKSITSTLLGIARGEGLIKSFDDPITDYLPDLLGTGYDGVKIIDLLQMASGIDFSEVYADGESDIARLGAACFGGPEGVDELTKTYGRKREPGTRFEYASVDTGVLGRLLRSVTSKSMAAYTQEKLWQPMGAEADAHWIIDSPPAEGADGEIVDDGVECAMGGFNATLRDYTRFGVLMAQDGMMGDRRILPKGWVHEATVPSKPFVKPGELEDGYKLGYQYQWWTFPGPDNAFVAEGIHGQLILVNPAINLVMVKTSDWETAWEVDKEAETWALFDAIAASLRG